MITKINPIAVFPIKHSTTGTIPGGRGGLLTGVVDTDGSLLVTAPTGADSVCHIVSRKSCSDTVVGDGIQVGMSNVQLKIGSAGVSFGDKLNIQDATGVWQTAPAASQNVYYIALETVAAGAMCWAMPIASRAI